MLSAVGRIAGVAHVAIRVAIEIDVGARLADPEEPARDQHGGQRQPDEPGCSAAWRDDREHRDDHCRDEENGAAGESVVTRGAFAEQQGHAPGHITRTGG